MSRLWLILGLFGALGIVLVLRHDTGSVFGLQTDLFAQASIYGVWAVLILSAAISHGGGFRDAIRKITAWLLICLALMSGYLYRYELQDFASRLTAGFIAGSPIGSTNADGRTQVTLIRSSNGHFEARGIANDLPVFFLVDTGASHVVFTYEDARKIGLRPERLAYDWPVSTANGRTTNAKTEVAALSIGRIERRNLTVFVAQENALEQSLLGMSFLSTLGAFEYRGDRLVLTD